MNERLELLDIVAITGAPQHASAELRRKISAVRHIRDKEWAKLKEDIKTDKFILDRLDYDNPSVAAWETKLAADEKALETYEEEIPLYAKWLRKNDVELFNHASSTPEIAVFGCDCHRNNVQEANDEADKEWLETLKPKDEEEVVQPKKKQKKRHAAKK
jgi:hypothetical protein